MATKGTFDFNLLRAMEVFVAVVETRQVTKAAGLLGMTQSAASQHLRSLETAFGTSLLDRSARPIGLTRPGVALHKRAARILGEIEELKAELRRLTAVSVPLLRVGLLPSLTTVLSPPIVRFARERMEVPEVILRSSLASGHQELLVNRQVDLIITSDALYDVDGLERHLLLKEPFYLVVPRDYEGPSDDLAALAERLPFLRFLAGSPVGRHIEQHLRRVRLALPRAAEVERAGALLAMVAGGQGFSILSPTLLHDGWDPARPVAIKPLPIVPLARTITLVGRQRELGNLPAVLAAEIKQILVQSLRQVLADHLPAPGEPFLEEVS